MSRCEGLGWLVWVLRVGFLSFSAAGRAVSRYIYIDVSGVIVANGILLEREWQHTDFANIYSVYLRNSVFQIDRQQL